MRSGDAYVASLRDGRAVFLDGERVDDVTKHPAFAEPSGASRHYDARAAESARDTFVDPATGERIGTMWLIPRSAEDLGRAPRVHRFWAEGSYGLMGRTPDHVAACSPASRRWRHALRRAAARASATTSCRFYASARATRISTSPTPSCRRRSTARSPPTGTPSRSCIRASCARRDDGIVVRGAHSVATSATHGRLAVRQLHHAARAGRRGLRDLARHADERARGCASIRAGRSPSQATSVFDYPLSSRFDEVDTTVVFDDVVRALGAGLHLPERGAGQRAVPRLARRTRPANFQALVRFGVKLEFAGRARHASSRGRSTAVGSPSCRPRSAARSPPCARRSTRW